MILKSSLTSPGGTKTKAHFETLITVMVYFSNPETKSVFF